MKLWADIKEWDYVDKKFTQVAEKINHSSIINYINVPIMASFGGMKETTVKFIIIQYHNDIFYFNRLVEISGEVISNLTGLSNQGELVPFGIKEGLVEELTGSTSGKKSKGLMIIQIQTQTPQIVAKIIAFALTSRGRGSKIKLDMLEVVDTIADTGEFYRWVEYVANMLKGICEKC